MIMIRSILLAAVVAAVGTPALAVSVNITVPGTANIWLAGGIPGDTEDNGDTLPNQAPTEVAVIPGATQMTFTNVFGLADNNATGLQQAPPDGFPASTLERFFGAENGIANIRAPLASLIGVFINDLAPTDRPDPPPLGLNFEGTAPTGFVSVGGGIDYLSLSPELFQPFFIGDGLSGNGPAFLQTIGVPTGATTLALGIMDGFGWAGNQGQFTLTVNTTVSQVPVPAAFWLLVTALVALVSFRKAQSRK